MIIMGSLLIFIDYLLLLNGMGTSQIMYKPDAHTYATKPMGIFGQFSINSSYIISSYLFWLSIEKDVSYIKKIIVFLLVSIAIFLQDSGTGYFLYFILLFSLLWKYRSFKFIFMPFVMVVIYLIIYHGIIEKISYENIQILVNFFIAIIEYDYIVNINSFMDFLFGIDGNYNMKIDLGPLFLIAKLGFLYFLLYSIGLIYFLYIAPDFYFKIAIICLIVANLHYPALFYPIMNIVLPILFIYSINHKKQRIQNVQNNNNR